MPRISKGLLLFLLVGLIIGLSNPAMSQDPEGALDSLWIECTYDSGLTVLMDLMFFSDNTGTNQIVGIGMPLWLTVSNNALASFDTTLATLFTSTMISTWAQRVFGLGDAPNDDPTTSPFHFTVGGVDFTLVGITGQGVIAHFKLTLTGDTSTITIDTLPTLTLDPRLTTAATLEYTPGWASGGYTCIALDVRDIKKGEPANRPTSFSLGQNYPNPFNATTLIEFALPQASQVKLELFNVLGQKVRTLVDEKLQAGYKQIVWDGKNQSGDPVTSGIYFYRMQAGGQFSDLKKMLLIK